MSRAQTGGHFIRSGFLLLFLGFVMSMGMVLHYVVGAQYPTGHDFMSNITLWWACPWTLSTTVVLGRALHGCHWRRPSPWRSILVPPRSARAQPPRWLGGAHHLAHRRRTIRAP